MVRFAIVAELRSGYQLLATSLNSHPEVLCLGEIFGSDRNIRIKSLFGQPFKPIEESQNAIEYLNHIQNPNKSAIGFKLNYVCAKQPNWKCLWSHMRNEKWKIIHLTRRNLLDRLLSEKLAAIERKWNFKTYEKTTTITLDELDRCSKRSYTWQLKTRKFFKDCPVLELEYEDINFEKVQEFLGLPIRKLSSNMIKQRQGNQGKYIANYKQLQTQCLTHKKYTKFLTDLLL